MLAAAQIAFYCVERWSLSLWIYYAVSFVSSFSPNVAMLLSITADVTRKHERGLAFSLIVGSLALFSTLALSVFVAFVGDWSYVREF